MFQAKLRRDLAYSTMLCTRAVDRLASAVGAHGMLEDTPIQRAFCDVRAVSNHGANELGPPGRAVRTRSARLSAGPGALTHAAQPRSILDYTPGQPGASA